MDAMMQRCKKWKIYSYFPGTKLGLLQLRWACKSILQDGKIGFFGDARSLFLYISHGFRAPLIHRVGKL